MGYEQAMRFMMENRTVLGEEAVALGMAGEVVDDSQFGRIGWPVIARNFAIGHLSLCGF